MSSTGGVEGKLHVGIFTPAFSYPASLSYAATVKAALTDLGLQEDECEFLKQDNDKLACVIKNNKFTLQYVEQTYAHNKALLDQLERAAEGLVAFQTKLDEDAEVIRELKNQLSSANAAWELKYKEEHNLRMILQGRLDQLKIVVNSDISDSTTEPSRPKIPKLQLGIMNGNSSEKLPTPLLISELRNGVTSPRNSPTNMHMDAPRFPHSSPRETHSPSPQPITNMNGKRSISSSNILSADILPHGNGKHATGKCSNEASPRATLSPRGTQTSPRTTQPPSTSPRSSTQPPSTSPRGVHAVAAQAQVPAGHVHHVKEHLRRHSTNFGEEGGFRRQNNAEIIGRPSSSEIPPSNYFDLTQPDASMPVVHSFSYGNADSFKRKSVVVHIKSRSEAALDVPAETLSQCRLCNCAKFRVTNVEWMCNCGHANIKHAVFLKASPAPSPTVSPRKVG